MSRVMVRWSNVVESGIIMADSFILVLFRKNATANFVTRTWRKTSGSRSWSSMIFCHQNMAQNAKEMR